LSTFEGFQAIVYHYWYMTGQMDWLTKTPVTLGTLEVFRTTVNLHVSMQISRSTEAFVTLSTFEGCRTIVYHHRYMTGQMDWPTKTPVILGTLEDFRTTVNLHVSIQISRSTKAFVTMSTFEGFLATV